MPVSWQTRLFSLSAMLTFLWIVSRTRRPGTDVSRPRASASASRRSCGMSFSAQTYRCAAASSTACCRSVASCGGCSTSCPPSEYDTFQETVAHHAVAPVCAACDLTAGVEPVERRLRVGVDHEAAVLVVQHGVRQNLLGQRIDPRSAIAPEHVR